MIIPLAEFSVCEVCKQPVKKCWNGSTWKEYCHNSECSEWKIMNLYKRIEDLEERIKKLESKAL